MSTPEGKVKDDIKEVLDKHGVWSCMPIGTAYGKSGVPDHIGCMKRWKGRMIAIEAKRGDNEGEVTALQAEQLRQISLAGGFCVVIDTPDTVRALDTILSDQWDSNCERNWNRMLRWMHIHAARIT